MALLVFQKAYIALELRQASFDQLEETKRYMLLLGEPFASQKSEIAEREKKKRKTGSQSIKDAKQKGLDAGDFALDCMTYALGTGVVADIGGDR